MTKISACLVIRNEEKLIKRCLDSLKGAVDEIVIVHDGHCSDKTLHICRGYTTKIFVRRYIGEAEPHRPFSFSKATGEWILWIDADEYFSEGLRKGLRKLAKGKDASAYKLAYDVPYKNRVLRRIGIGNAYRLCFFRKDSYSMKGIIHESPAIKGKTKKSDLLLHHRPNYDPHSFRTLRGKYLKWAKLQAKMYIANGKARYPAFFYLFEAVFLFFFVNIRFFIQGSFLNGYAGLKIAFMESLYNVFVYWYVFKTKFKRNIFKAP